MSNATNSERLRWFNIRVSDDERDKLRALADAEGEPAAILMRRWIRQHYEARFGATPPPKATSTKR